MIIWIDASTAGADPLVISYSVTGAAAALDPISNQPEMTKISWRVLQALNVAVQEASGQIELPQGTQTYDVDCQAGVVAATVSCSTYASGTVETPYPQFTDGPRAAGEVIDLAIAVPALVIVVNQVTSEHWSLDRAFTASGVPLLVPLLVLLAGAAALYLLHRAKGADPAGQAPILVGHFVPNAAGEQRFELVEKLSPGEVGTLVDELVDPIDITAASSIWLCAGTSPSSNCRTPM